MNVYVAHYILFRRSLKCFECFKGSEGFEGFESFECFEGVEGPKGILRFFSVLRVLRIFRISVNNYALHTFVLFKHNFLGFKCYFVLRILKVL